MSAPVPGREGAPVVIERPPVAGERPPAWLGDTMLRFAMVAALLFACLRIAQPFVVVLIWSVLLAVMFWPLHLRLRALGLRNAWSATLIGVAGVALLVAPAVAVVDSFTASALQLVRANPDGVVVLPALPWLRGVPVAGAGLLEQWDVLRADVPQALAGHALLVEKAVLWVAARASELASGFFRFVAAIALAAMLLAYGAGLRRIARGLVDRFAANPVRGERLFDLSVDTVRSVLKGVIGMALVQAVLLGSSFFVFDLPFAGMLVMVLLVFGIVQIPSQLLTVPAAFYLLSVAGGQAALLFAGWAVAVAVFDAGLKPFMMGIGLAVPVPITLIGVIGGALAAGLLGLFVGPVLLAIGYILLLEWLGEPLPGEKRAGKVAG
jgi:predicted PurR-regulated permease PerM